MYGPVFESVKSGICSDLLHDASVKHAMNAISTIIEGRYVSRVDS